TLLLREMNLTSNVAIPKSSTVGRSTTIKPSRERLWWYQGSGAIGDGQYDLEI
ncbi:hypothetical protein Dimus_005075, partial [Dionaea muscipula]